MAFSAVTLVSPFGPAACAQEAEEAVQQIDEVVEEAEQRVEEAAEER